jgi:protein arginine N-methyltransferase 5
MPLRVDIVALERNPDAHSHCVANIALAPASGHSVCFVHADVVCVGAEELRNLCGTDFELVVSELLGSFADNELAPEVLSVVALNTQLLARECAFIPQQHTSYLYPVSSTRLRGVLRAHSAVPSDVRYGSPWVISTAEIPHCRQLPRLLPLPAMHFSYACNAVAGSGMCSSFAVGSESVCAATLPAGFCGQHDVQDQSRTLTWALAPTSTLHLDGMLGVFHCVLYGDVTLSTVPGRETPGLAEWRPMFFPVQHVQVALQRPEQPAVGWRLVVSITRAVRVDRVFYSWELDVRDDRGVVRSQQTLNRGGQFSFMQRVILHDPHAATALRRGQSSRGAARDAQEQQQHDEKTERLTDVAGPGSE